MSRLGLEIFEGEYAAKYRFVQAFGHGPVFTHAGGRDFAYCIHTGCKFRGPDRTTQDAALADAVAHLESVTGKEWRDL